MIKAVAPAVLCTATLACLCLCGPAALASRAEDSLAAARDLYAAAAYRDALTMLDALKSRRPAAGEAIEIEKYRAFCLLALGRTGEAEEAIVTLLGVQPRFRLNEDEVSRRIFTVFEETRRRTLPRVMQRVYEQAKQAYDRQDFEQARAGFGEVVSLAGSADIPGDGRLVQDLQTLARGFLVLVGANAPPLRGTPLALPAIIVPATKTIYDAGDTGIVPPVVVEQRVPAWPPGLQPARSTTGVIEVTINERGEVESAAMAPPFNTVYDEVLLTAAKTWRYRPALCGQQPVKFRRRIQIVAGPQSPQLPEGDVLHPAAR